MLALLAVAAVPRADAALSLDEPAFVRSPDAVNEFAVNLGGFHPTSKFVLNGPGGGTGERFGNNGFLFGFDYLHQAVGPLSIGGEFDYLNRGEYNVTNVSGAVPSDTRVRGDSMLLMAVARLRAPGHGWRPYAMGGIGFHKTHMDLYVSAPATDELNLVRDDVTGTAFMMRAGVEKVSKQGGFIGAEVGYIRMDSQVYHPTATGALAGYGDVRSSGDGMTFILRCGTRFGAGS